VWSEEPFDLESAVRLHDRQVRELVPRGRFSAKYSPGGLVELEYAVQYLQLQHGRKRRELRTPSTLVALDGLRAAGLLEEAEHRSVREAYLFWRTVTDALRMVRGDATDLLLPAEDSDEFRLLARRMRYEGAEWKALAQGLARDIRRHRETVRAFFARHARAQAPASP
jgi:glutamate-ammonia-ligase adenylyltransferase